MMLGYQASDSETTCVFFLPFFFQADRPNNPILGNAFDAKQNKIKGMALTPIIKLSPRF